MRDWLISAPAPKPEIGGAKRSVEGWLIIAIAAALGAGCSGDDKKHEQELARKDSVIAEKNKLIADKDRVIAERDKLLGENKKLIAELEQKVKELSDRVVALEKQGGGAQPAVKVDPAGVPLVISITRDGAVYVAGRRLGSPELDDVFRVTAARNPETQLLIRSDPKAPYRQIVGVMDQAKRAGLRRIAIAASKANSPSK